MSYRYYLTQRPPMPGAVPESYTVTATEDFGMKKLVPMIGEAYGWVEYDHPLTQKQVKDYELTLEVKRHRIRLRGSGEGIVYCNSDTAQMLSEFQIPPGQKLIIVSVEE